MPTRPEDSPFSQSLLRWYLSVLGAPREHTQVMRVGLEGDAAGVAHPRREFLVAEVELPSVGGRSCWFYGTLGTAESELGRPSDHEHEFILISDTRERGLFRTMAVSRLHHSLPGEALGDNHTFRLDEDSTLRKRGYTNVLVLRADFVPLFRGRNETNIAGLPVRVHALLLLTEDEWKLKVARDVDALFDDFRARGRDLLALRPESAAS